MAPLFIETHEESLKKSGKFVTWKKNQFCGIDEEETVLDTELQEKPWKNLFGNYAMIRQPGKLSDNLYSQAEINY